MTKPYKVGILGTGFIGPAHIESVRRLGFEAAALAGSSQEAADAAAARLFVPKAYGDWREMLKNPDLDVIHITTPNYLHYEQAKAALLAGKHVICEKPLAMNTTESAELVALAREKGLVNAVNFNIRFYPLAQDARARVRAGELGDRLYIIQGSYLQDWLLYDTDWNWRLEPDLGGNLRAVADIGSHWMDLVTFITGTKITHVFADFETFIPVRRKPTKHIETFGGKIEVAQAYEEKPIHTEDYAAVLLKFDNGARGVMSVAQVASGRKNRLFFEINGSQSSLMWDSENPNELMIGHRSGPNQVIIKDPSLISEPARWSASYPGGHAEGFPDTFKQLHSAVYRYISAEDFTAPADFPTFQDGHNTLAVDAAILKSAKMGGWVEVVY
ncbi:MAG: Gfo/Idh/MocA family oxidoreductase [Anaerolineales bacterium]